MKKQDCGQKMRIDLYSGGQMMPGRSWNPNLYRYGHNTQEKDDEIFVGAYTAEFWEYDARIIRRWNTDPITIAWNSPYACFNGNPIYYKDPRGLKGDPPIKKGDKVDLGNGQSYTASADEVSVTASKSGFLSKVGGFFKNAWDAFVRFDRSLENQKDKPDFQPAVKTNMSGMQPTSDGPQKGVSMSSNAKGIETTTPYNPGSILMGVGGGAPSQTTWSTKIVEILEKGKGVPDAFNTGGDAVDGIKEQTTAPVLTNGNSASNQNKTEQVAKQVMKTPEPPVLIYYSLQTGDGSTSGTEQATQKNYKQIIKNMEAKGYVIDGFDRQLKR